MPGRRTSVYLTEELDEAVKASGLPLPDLLWRAIGAHPKTVTSRRTADADCPHPKGRLQKNGTYCPACGTGGLTGG